MRSSPTRTEGRALGFLGEPAVNVTRLNLASHSPRGDDAMAVIDPRRPRGGRSTPCGRRGELRIYLGAAPGVGKTYAMLGEAHRRAARGTDVVVGLVETHGRAKTAALLEGLEVLPRRTVAYRGVELTELDVDAVLARAPQVVLVDELAHTNAPGSRHAKRWQDVDDLLDAGITVLTTVNIQHLESLNDVIERITGVRQQETVPGRGGAPRPAGRARRHHPRGAAPPDGPRQRLRPGEGRRGDGQLLPAAQPHRAAGDGAALARRPGRGRPGAAIGPTSRSPTSGRPASGSSSR